jgi:hypothetical protein
MIKSVRAVLFGILFALGLGALVILGIVAPIFTRFFGPELAPTALPTITFPAIIMAFAAAFAFYFGSMYASYKAPSRRRLHGVLVGVLSFAISPLANLAVGDDPFANLRTPEASLFTGILFVVVLAASYVGARRGEALYAHNQAYIRRQRRQQETKKDS